MYAFLATCSLRPFVARDLPMFAGAGIIPTCLRGFGFSVSPSVVSAGGEPACADGAELPIEPLKSPSWREVLSLSASSYLLFWLEVIDVASGCDLVDFWGSRLLRSPFLLKISIF